MKTKGKEKQSDLNGGTCSSDDNAIRLYLKEINNIPPLSREEEEEIAKQAALGDKKAQDQIIKSNLRFVVMMAKKYQHKGLALEDLISEGNLGLLTALKHYDVEKGYRFITYAVWWIRQSIIKAIHEKGRMIRLPCNKNIDLAMIDKTRQLIKNEPGRKTGSENEIEEISSFLGIAPEKTANLIHLSQEVMSLDDPATKCVNFLTIKDNIEDDNSASPIDEAIAISLKSELDAAISSLEKRSAEIIRSRFGLGEGRPLTLKEIGKHYHLSKERVRQIEKRALKQLQESEYSDRLESFIA